MGTAEEDLYESAAVDFLACGASQTEAPVGKPLERKKQVSMNTEREAGSETTGLGKLKKKISRKLVRKQGHTKEVNRWDSDEPVEIASESIDDTEEVTEDEIGAFADVIDDYDSNILGPPLGATQESPIMLDNGDSSDEEDDDISPSIPHEFQAKDGVLGKSIGVTSNIFRPFSASSDDTSLPSAAKSPNCVKDVCETTKSPTAGGIFKPFQMPNGPSESIVSTSSADSRHSSEHVLPTPTGGVVRVRSDILCVSNKSLDSSSALPKGKSEIGGISANSLDVSGATENPASGRKNRLTRPASYRNRSREPSAGIGTGSDRVTDSPGDSGSYSFASHGNLAEGPVKPTKKKGNRWFQRK